MGDQLEAGIRAIQLPGSVTYAFLPHTPHSQQLANTAYEQGKEVMLHLPMQAITAKALGPGGLTLNMSRAQFHDTLLSDLASIPHVVGINNHMGSLLTRHPGHMQWLMEEIKQHNNLYFIDSRTTNRTVAYQLAQEQHVPSRQRDVFLDDDARPDAVIHQFTRLIEKASREGSAIGIGHPYESTLQVLAVMIPELEHLDIELVPVSQLVYEKPTPTTRIAKTRQTPPPATITEPLVFNLTTSEPASKQSDKHLIH